MNFPKLKNAVLCRILVYVIVIGIFAAPAIIVGCIDMVPDSVKVMFILVCSVGLIVYLIKNFVVLMSLDCTLALLHCRQTARKQFTLPKSFSVSKLDKRITRFGKKCDSRPLSPMPQALMYKFKPSITVYAKGIETVIAAYSVEYLDKALYTSIFNSAVINSKALEGKKKPRFLDKKQKKSPLNRVTIILILAKSIDSGLSASLFDTVQKNSKDGFDVSILPCVMNLENHCCIFDSERIPYIGFQYPVKNRGIKTIRNLVFYGKIPYSSSPYVLDPMKDEKTGEDLSEISLWTFWRRMKKEMISDDKEIRTRFTNMEHKQVFLDNGYLYMKWEDRGIWLTAEFDEEQKTVKLDAIDSWVYPKSGQIAKKTIVEMRRFLDEYFADIGYTTKYMN